MGEVKELKRDVKEVKTEGPIPLNEIPTNIKMPEQLNEDELRRENVRLKSILAQAEKAIKDLQNGFGLKRIEFLFAILADKGFCDCVNTKVREMICEELGVEVKETCEAADTNE